MATRADLDTAINNLQTAAVAAAAQLSATVASLQAKIDAAGSVPAEDLQPEVDRLNLIASEIQSMGVLGQPAAAPPTSTTPEASAPESTAATGGVTPAETAAESPSADTTTAPPETPAPHVPDGTV